VSKRKYRHLRICLEAHVQKRAIIFKTETHQNNFRTALASNHVDDVMLLEQTSLKLKEMPSRDTNISFCSEFPTL